MALCQVKKLVDQYSIHKLLELLEKNPDIKNIIYTIIQNRPFELFAISDIYTLSDTLELYNILKYKLENIYEINIQNKQDIYSTYIAYIIDYISCLFCDFNKINQEFNIKNIIINGGIVYNIELIFTGTLDNYNGKYIFSSASLNGLCGATWNNCILPSLINCTYERLYDELIKVINFRQSFQLLKLINIKLIKTISKPIDIDEPIQYITLVNL